MTTVGAGGGADRSGLTEPEPAGRGHEPAGAPEVYGRTELCALAEVSGLALKDPAGLALVELEAFAEVDWAAAFSGMATAATAKAAPVAARNARRGEWRRGGVVMVVVRRGPCPKIQSNGYRAARTGDTAGIAETISAGSQRLAKSSSCGGAGVSAGEGGVRAFCIGHGSSPIP